MVIWKEEYLNDLYRIINPELDPKVNFKARINMIYAHRKYDDLWVFDDEVNKLYKTKLIAPGKTTQLYKEN